MVENKDDEFSEQDLQDMLKMYYKRLFPRNVFYRWLSYGQSEYLCWKQSPWIWCDGCFGSINYAKIIVYFVNSNIFFVCVFFSDQLNSQYSKIVSFHSHWRMRSTFGICHTKIWLNLRMICGLKIHWRSILVRWCQFDRVIIVLVMFSQYNVSSFLILIWPIMMKCVHAVPGLIFVKNAGNSWLLHAEYLMNHCEVCEDFFLKKIFFFVGSKFTPDYELCYIQCFFISIIS